ncbi:MAG: peptidylprolyl isomerase, partial [Candidatus Adiutrix sp.]
MLGYIRKNAQSKLVWLIIGAIAIVFVFFGVGGGGPRGWNFSVAGQDVSPHEFDRMVNLVTQNARTQLGDEITPEIHQMIRIEAINAIINQRLTLQFGEHMGLNPSDLAVARQVASMPHFQVDGLFNADVYDSWLSDRRLTAANHERGLRDEQTISRVTYLIAMLSSAFMPEALESYHFSEDQVAFDYWFFPAAPHREALAPTQDDLLPFFLQNNERWRKPASMSLEYVTLNPADFMESVEVSDLELREAYADNSFRFQIPQKVAASHILFRFPSLNPSDEEKAAALAKAEKTQATLTVSNFAEIAAAISEDPSSAPLGGSLGEIYEGMTFPRFEEALFTLPLNEVSPPVETEVGYHLIMVSSRQDASVRAFDDVKDELEAPLKLYKARSMAVTVLEDLINRTETNPDLAQAAASLSLLVETSEYFTADSPLDLFENDANAIRRAFEAPLGRVAHPIETENLLVLYKPLERKESYIPNLADVVDEVTAAWLDQEATRLASLSATSFIATLNTSSLAGATVDTPPSVSRGETPMQRRAALSTEEIFSRLAPQPMLAAV